MAPEEFVNTSNPLPVSDHKRKAPPKSADMELNMTAMIDVLFMLILFFLMGARFVQGEGTLQSKLPDVGPPQKDIVILPPVSITVDEDTPRRPDELGAPIFKLGPSPEAGKPDVRRQVSYSELRTELKSKDKNTTKISIHATARVSWNYVLRVFNLAKGLGFEDINWSGN